MTWLPPDFAHPLHVDVPGGFHLRPIRGADADLDHPTVMGSRERLWSIFGEAWGWPADTITYEANLADLERHAAEADAHESFNYVLLNDDETVELGCVYIDPPEKAGADAEISWWVVDSAVGGAVEQALDALVPQWIADDWPFVKPRYIGRELSWAEWLRLPDAAE
ncbi:GNAT family N-acetyltransferase [Streptomyces sp. SID12501]|uniref:N-acetyltransferase n=1 Tax=Streptomyces sp. SID12501 TaxID=2706042 RepID=A0A6B3C651_9ACTN|nr:GNAT family N-acetyltransferase [Streptomyces sp. SID12501]NEC91884.1 N-acetyltransferase [Streptomyces sp. SID12501]